MSVQRRPGWAPDEVDIDTPSTARMYDYYLGGSHNFAADRQLAEQALRAWPDAQHLVRANRAFLRRAVSFLAHRVDQFLDLGAGIPTVGAVHEVAREKNPRARTVYVDCDQVAVAHSRRILAAVPGAGVVHADLRDSAAVLAAVETAGLLDLRRPVAVLMFAVLPFVPDEDDPAGIVAAYRDATAPGSYLALSHGTDDYRPQNARAVGEVYTRASHTMTLRSRTQIAALLDGYELVEPGLVDLTCWRPEPDGGLPDPLGGDVQRYSMYAAVGWLPQGAADA
ncbi:SAM-dependent methyltransferase [Actinocrinis puniceicyclus]|uniref:SAM-dependent methyltransferase n=1 Tax=Actinocrinis puniceicyclus TaxID=977794 RepID=A0A8J8BD58_9ACTN|nr:SAM-dependent methyltransferase [Actinocrinis puniceicyclus]MBS2965857.1 SAM-dependent methyltransferase [Actinocrinis puniceicyclus]